MVARALEGDDEAMAILHATYAPYVRGALIRLVGPEAAEDLEQEVFLRAWTGLPTFRGEARLGWWLNRIAVNCGIRYLKRSRSRCREIPADRAVPRPGGPEELAIEREDREEARWALQRLEPDERRLLVLREVFGLTYEEIRSRLEISFVGTVRSRLHKAREMLRRAWSWRRERSEGKP